MNELIALAVKGIQAAIKYAPGLINDLRPIFTKADPTEADWNDLHAKINAKTYEDYVPETALRTQPVADANAQS